MVIKADDPRANDVLPWEPPPFDEEPVLPPVETRWERGAYPWEEDDHISDYEYRDKRRIIATALARYGSATAELAEITRSAFWVEELTTIIDVLTPLAPSIASRLASRANAVASAQGTVIERNAQGIASFSGRAGEYANRTATEVTARPKSHDPILSRP